MASSIHLIAFCSFLFISSTFAAQTNVNPKALLLPVIKDPKTLQYITHIKQRTPLVSLPLTVDIGGPYLWTDCDTHGYVSSTYKFYDCHTSQCRNSRQNTYCNTCDDPARPGCHNDSCAVSVLNNVARVGQSGELTADLVSIQSTDGKNPNRVVQVPEFFFVCTVNRYDLLKDLANGVTGIAGFGRSEISLSTQFSRFFNYRKIFGVCLSSSKGVIFLGEGPYMFQPNVNAATNLTYTPLIINQGDWIEKPSSDYFIGVKSIKINGQVVPINTTLLSFDQNGEGGTKISTVNPYTVLEPSIYDAFVNAFVIAMSKGTRVAPAAPFEVCYSSNGTGSTREGPAVPVIDLVLQSEDVYWRISGGNLMVQVSKDVICLGFVKQGYISPAHAITLGGHQLENNLLQFNVAKSVLGFSSSLLSQKTTCTSFNFTSTPFIPLQEKGFWSD